MTIESRLRAAVGTVVFLLVQREYLALATMTGDCRLTAEMLQTAVADYGRVLVTQPAGDVPPDLEFIPDMTDPSTTHAVMSLWTVEEGESDLGLELTLIVNSHDLIDLRIDGLHVL